MPPQNFFRDKMRLDTSGHSMSINSFSRIGGRQNDLDQTRTSSNAYREALDVIWGSLKGPGKDLRCTLRHFPMIILPLAVSSIFKFDSIVSAILQAMETNMCLLFWLGFWKKVGQESPPLSKMGDMSPPPPVPYC